MKRTTDQTILAAQTNLEAAKAFSKDVYVKSEEFSAKRIELLGQIEDIKKPHAGTPGGTIEQILQSAKNRQAQLAELQAQADALAFSVSGLDLEKRRSAAGVTTAEDALLETRYAVALQKEQALCETREFKKLKSQLIEHLALATAAARSKLGGTLDPYDWLAELFGGLEISDEQWAASLAELGMQE